MLSVRAGGPAQPGDRFTVGSQPLSLSAEVSAAATSVTGFARKDQKPLAGAMIVLIPRARNPQDHAAAAQPVFAGLVRRDQSDSDGSFSLMNVVPGAYTVVAIEDGWNLGLERPRGHGPLRRRRNRRHGFARRRPERLSFAPGGRRKQVNCIARPAGTSWKQGGEDSL